MTQKINQQTRRAKIKDQPFVNLLMPIGSDAEREDLEKQSHFACYCIQAKNHLDILKNL